MKQQGTITKWDDARGFGFVTPVAGGREVFLHISSIRHAGTRPSVGLKVAYEPGRDERGRACANNVELQDAPINAGPAFKAFIVVAAFFMLLGFMFVTGQIPLALPAIYVAFSVFSFLLYAWDKSAARRGDRRTRESTLHLLTLAGGWPGALYAQQLLRHKSSKRSFRFTFWMTVMLNLGLLAYMASNEGRWLGALLDEYAAQGLTLLRSLF